MDDDVGQSEIPTTFCQQWNESALKETPHELHVQNIMMAALSSIENSCTLFIRK
jgi:hypothetical protein